MSVLGTPKGETFSSWANKSIYQSMKDLNYDFIMATYTTPEIKKFLDMEFKNGKITNKEYEERIEILENKLENSYKENEELKNITAWENMKEILIIAGGTFVLGFLLRQ